VKVRDFRGVTHTFEHKDIDYYKRVWYPEEPDRGWVKVKVKGKVLYLPPHCWSYLKKEE